MPRSVASPFVCAGFQTGPEDAASAGRFAQGRQSPACLELTLLLWLCCECPNPHALFNRAVVNVRFYYAQTWHVIFDRAALAIDKVMAECIRFRGIHVPCNSSCKWLIARLLRGVSFLEGTCFFGGNQSDAASLAVVGPCISFEADGRSCRPCCHHAQLSQQAV